MSRKLFHILSALLLIALLAAACAPAAAPTTAPAETEVVAPTEKPAEVDKPIEPPAATEEMVMTEAPEATEAPAATEAPMEEGMMLPEVDPATVSGNIVSAGSSTVFPLSEAIAELFKSEGFTGDVTIDSIGTGGGFERFCKTGETDVANASRAIKDSEIESCTAISRNPVEFRVGTDALAVVVSSENDFVTDVTKEELAKIFSKDVTKWNEVRPEWPDEDILRFSPGTDSGTFDYFVEAIMNPAYVVDATADAGKGEEAILTAANTQFSEDDNVLVQGVEGSPYAIGYFGYAYYLNNQEQLTALSVDGVEPNEETAESNEYPISRPLFIYSDPTVMAEKPQVAAYINFFLTRVNDVITEVGYFPASPAALDAAKQAWLDATSGEIMASGVELPEVDPATVSGNVVSAGSSTVFPLSEAIAELFKSEGFTGDVTIDSIGTGGGFERFCKTGETDVANASRAIKDSEIESCTAISRNPVEFRVGTDALAVVVSSENDFVTDVTKEELAKIFSKDVTKWNEVRPEWPDEDILRFSPGTDSGTFDYFVEAIMNPAYVVDATADAGKGEEAILTAANTQFSEDDNVLVQGVEGSPYAIGYFGYAYYLNNQEQLTALSVDGVEPNEETAESNEYPISRPLFIYSDPTVMAEKPQVAAYINFFLSRVNDVITEVGYFPASPAALDAAKQAWLDAMGQ